MKGYRGKILRVNLTERTSSIEPLNIEDARNYIGGSGLGIRMAYNEVPPGTDPLSPEAKLFILTGPVTGTQLGTAGRYQVIYKSPLTRILCDSSSGGFWGAELKYAGYDGLVIEDASSSPVYLYIRNDEVEFKDASRHWGKHALQVQADLLDEVNEESARVLSIGPAGENCVLMACIVNDAARTAGRGGCGAVLGSKKLKAIVIRGTNSVDLHDQSGFKQVAVKINKLNATDPKMANLKKYGTAVAMDSNWPISDIPVKNWSVGSSESICMPLGGIKLLEYHKKNHNACHRCTIGCARWVTIADGPYKMEGPGPEFETLGTLGTLCLISNIEAVSYMNNLCNEYGLDTISLGATIAFAMECYEKGYLKKDDLDGIELTWGNVDAVIELIELAGKNTGAGKLIGIGSRNLAVKIGNDSIDFAVQVKGLELPMHDHRARYSWASTYAASPRGACHLHGVSAVFESSKDPIPEWGFTGEFENTNDHGKAEMSLMANNLSNIFNSMVMCYFATILLDPSDYCKLLNSATGSDYMPMDLFKIGSRINALHRAYNYRCGSRRSDDMLPPRAMMPLPDGGAEGLVPDLQFQLDELYSLRGWEPDGRPSEHTLSELNLEDVVRDLFPKK